jgi:hypothetical protein
MAFIIYNYKLTYPKYNLWLPEIKFWEEKLNADDKGYVHYVYDSRSLPSHCPR